MEPLRRSPKRANCWTSSARRDSSSGKESGILVRPLVLAYYIRTDYLARKRNRPNHHSYVAHPWARRSTSASARCATLAGSPKCSARFGSEFEAVPSRFQSTPFNEQSHGLLVNSLKKRSKKTRSKLAL